ncbi:DUF2892 domain-containing protein [Allosaccharopolyspora coralli]|uniref:DUF2892 domain-containing protein n=1 Tax=Allosaccharopolyspora coralli TaxID=2665642 RepID=A0A5Q3Q906_9PSEU|nr:rhodanese-like domain-containing protein [Allosaccharopolyspora coralli]QGK70863.1 DUF2892 domain-containing protein [Allosaccharopolyspora coralli]
MSDTRPPELSAAAVRDLLDSQPSTRVIDVRTAGEFQTTRLPGSFNVPLDVIQAHGPEWLVDHDDPVVLVCGSGVRAEQARRALEPTGLSQVVVLAGGVSEWPDEVEHGADHWELARQARLVLGLLILVNVVVMFWYDPAKWFVLAFGVGLMSSAFANDCGIERMLSSLPYNRRREGRATLEALTAPEVPGRRTGPSLITPGRGRGPAPGPSG